MSQNKPKMLGKIKEVTDTYVNARVYIKDILISTQFPRNIMDQTNIELKVGSFFYWEPLQAFARR